jgi:hypothetical protein
LSTYEYPSGAKYIGEMKDDLFHGSGTYYFVNGDIYTGEFNNDLMEGKGEYKYIGGHCYKGDFKNDKFNGFGTYYYDDNNYYVGRFKDDLMIGKLINKENENVFECIFQNDKLIKYTPIYKSDIENSDKYSKLGIDNIYNVF